MWYVYLLECADGSLYTGTTNNIERRLEEHNGSRIGAKYTRARRPVRLATVFEFADRSSAAKEEARIKRLSREAKMELIRKS